MDPILSVADLHVTFETPEGAVQAVSGLTFDLYKGQCLGIVGESGSGKSQTFLAILGLLAENGRASGKALYRGRNLLALRPQELNALRGDRIAMVFQDALTGLTPHMRIGDQLCEVLTTHKNVTRQEAHERVMEFVTRMRLPEAEKRLRMYPHELSGGMRQRIMIAMALLCEPDILVADEPTTALDVTIQAQVLRLLSGLKKHTKTAIVLITHDLGVVAGLCDRVIVMYGGRIAESGSTEDIFYDPRHPYTRGLLHSMPRLTTPLGGSLQDIPGQPPNMRTLPPGCAFAPRCQHAEERCRRTMPALAAFGNERQVACFEARMT